MKFQIIAGEPAVDFVNTLDNRPVPERRKDLLASYAHLAAWAVQAGAIPSSQHRGLVRQAEMRPKKAAAVLARAIELRESLYGIFSSILAGRRPAEEDLRMLNTYAGEAASHMQLKSSGKGFRLQWDKEDHPLDSLLWPVVRSATSLLTSSDLKCLRECDVDTCRWMFVDRSKNHSRRWCDMKVCGNRVKARKFYRRQRLVGSA